MSLLINAGEYNQVYHRYLLDLMTFLTSIEYDKKHMFSEDELNAIVPLDLKRWFFYKVFGFHEGTNVVVPGETAFNIRSTTLEMMKKAISWYLPDRISCWSPRSKTGNPTKSKEVNDFIKYMRVMEVRKVARPPQAKDAMIMPQFRAAIKLLESQDDFVNRHRMSTLMRYQYHLIARCDDMGNFLIRDIRGHSDPRFSSFALQTKVFWSKNVREERDCPNQIFFGSGDVDYCLLLSLGFYLEVWLIAGCGNQCELMWSDEMADRGSLQTRVKRAKNLYMSHLSNFVFSHPSFLAVTRSLTKMGTHSVRKYPATYAHSNGCTYEEIERRGRWKRNGKRIVDRYVDPDQKWLDGKVAAALCVGGPVKYVLVEGSDVSIEWVRVNVVPGITRFFGTAEEDDNTIAEVLGLAVLWGCMDEVYSLKVDQWLLEKVRGAYDVVRKLPVGVNPVEKRYLTVFPASGQLCVQDVGGINNNNNNNNNNNGYEFVAVHLLQQVQETLAGITEKLNNIPHEMREGKSEIKKQINIINKNLKRIGNLPFPRVHNIINNDENERNNNEPIEQMERGEEGRVGGDGPPPLLVRADLTSCPRTLADLWQEYTVGIGGRKPAKDFTPSERGAVKYKYCRRRVFWDCVSKHVNAGFTADTAIDRIKAAYGDRLSVYRILQLMRRDKKDGGHANLRI